MEIREKLFEMQDLPYRNFHKNLIPEIKEERIIGIRIPKLRALAKEMAREAVNGNWDMDEYLNDLPHFYYEENNLHAFLIEEIKDYDLCMKRMEQFLPYIDNWATCDSFFPKVLKKDLEKTLDKSLEFMNGTYPYMIRYGIEMQMKCFLEEKTFKEEYMEKIISAHEKALKKEGFSDSELYYIKMMTAWYFATALAKQNEAAMKVVRENRLDVWTHNKTIQKAVESYRISEEQKILLRTMKRKTK